MENLLNEQKGQLNVEEFGRFVSVYYKEDSFKSGTYLVEINWSATGSVPIEETEEFIDNLQKAIEFAKERRAEYEKEGLKPRD